MKKKKFGKIAAFGVALLVTAPTAVLMSACGGSSSKDDKIEHEIEQEIEHKADSAWVTNAENHWHDCIVKDDDHKYNQGAHTWTINSGNYTCSVCGYTKATGGISEEIKHTLNAKWSNDATSHWHGCAEDENDKHDLAAHNLTVKDGKITCTTCGYSETAENVSKEDLDVRTLQTAAKNTLQYQGGYTVVNFGAINDEPVDIITSYIPADKVYCEVWKSKKDGKILEAKKIFKDVSGRAVKYEMRLDQDGKPVEHFYALTDEMWEDAVDAMGLSDMCTAYPIFAGDEPVTSEQFADAMLESLSQFYDDLAVDEENSNVDYKTENNTLTVIAKVQSEKMDDGSYIVNLSTFKVVNGVLASNVITTEVFSAKGEVISSNTMSLNYSFDRETFDKVVDVEKVPEKLIDAAADDEHVKTLQTAIKNMEEYQGGFTMVSVSATPAYEQVMSYDPAKKMGVQFSKQDGKINYINKVFTDKDRLVNYVWAMVEHKTEDGKTEYITDSHYYAMTEEEWNNRMGGMSVSDFVKSMCPVLNGNETVSSQEFADSMFEVMGSSFGGEVGVDTKNSSVDYQVENDVLTVTIKVQSEVQQNGSYIVTTLTLKVNDGVLGNCLLTMDTIAGGKTIEHNYMSLGFNFDVASFNGVDHGEVPDELEDYNSGEEEHNPDTAVWRYDGENHWHGCTGHDSHVYDIAAHNWTIDGETYTCTDCGYSKTVTGGNQGGEQEHIADLTVWKYDEEKHWHGCATDANDSHTYDLGAHNWTIAGETYTCTECGYSKTVTQTPVTNHVPEAGDYYVFESYVKTEWVDPEAAEPDDDARARSLVSQISFIFGNDNLLFATNGEEYSPISYQVDGDRFYVEMPDGEGNSIVMLELTFYGDTVTCRQYVTENVIVTYTLKLNGKTEIPEMPGSETPVTNHIPEAGDYYVYESFGGLEYENGGEFSEEEEAQMQKLVMDVTFTFGSANKVDLLMGSDPRPFDYQIDGDKLYISMSDSEGNSAVVIECTIQGDTLLVRQQINENGYMTYTLKLTK